MRYHFLKDGVPHETLAEVLEKTVFLLFEFPLQEGLEHWRRLYEETAAYPNRVDIHAGHTLWRLLPFTEEVRTGLTVFFAGGEWPFHVVFLSDSLSAVAAIEDGEVLLIPEVGDAVETGPVLVGYPADASPGSGGDEGGYEG